MKLTLSWLKDHLETSASVAELAEKLAAIGLDVEGVDDPAAKLKAFTIARVLEAKPHPNADRLRVCKVDTGSGVETRKIASVGTAAGATTTLWQPLPDGPVITIPAGSASRTDAAAGCTRPCLAIHTPIHSLCATASVTRDNDLADMAGSFPVAILV